MTGPAGSFTISSPPYIELIPQDLGAGERGEQPSFASEPRRGSPQRPDMLGTGRLAAVIGATRLAVGTTTLARASTCHAVYIQLVTPGPAGHFQRSMREMSLQRFQTRVARGSGSNQKIH